MNPRSRHIRIALIASIVVASLLLIFIFITNKNTTHKLLDKYAPLPPINVVVPPASTTYSSIAVMWDKPEDYDEITEYEVYINDKLAGITDESETFYTAEDLAPGTEYKITVKSKSGSYESAASEAVKAKTDDIGVVRDVTMLPYNAKGDSITLDTASIQKAIDDCNPQDIVLLPEGKIFLCGALDLKSNMTFEINGVLLGSDNPKDYEKTLMGFQENYTSGISEGLIYTKEAPKRLIWSRVEGWEQYSYRSLINIGYLSENTDYSRANNYVCENVKIIGTGIIKGCADEAWAYYPPSSGNATKLAINEGDSADEFYDILNSSTNENDIRRRIRGRLINVSNAQNVYIKGVALSNPPFWTMHMIYSDSITTNGVSFQTKGLANGDGWDPDSSTNCIIFDCNFDTGDDCIAIKSGKNPEGNRIGRPSKNIKIIGCRSNGGHGVAVGSEMSGGVDGVYVRDCCISNSNYGIEFKANKDRGGYIKNVYVQDCTVDQILIHSVTYNADGAPADTLPEFSDFYFDRIKVIGYYARNDVWLDNVIQISGFTSENGVDSFVRNIHFNDIVLGTENNIEQSILLQRCKDIYFNNVKQSDGAMPNYTAEVAEGIMSDGKDITDSEDFSD